MATITSTAARITISGTYKAFTSTTGSTSTIIQYSSGDAPASGDAGRFLLWKNTVGDTSTWEIRYILSATATTVTVGDGGFSSAPGTGESFVISTNLADIKTAVPASVIVTGNQYNFGARDWSLQSGAFLADADKSLQTESAVATASTAAWQMDDSCALQFGRLEGGEANDSTITTGGCHLHLKATHTSGNGRIFSTASSRSATGAVINFYGCLVISETANPADSAFMAMSGPARIIGTTWGGPFAGRFYHEASEWAQCRFYGVDNGTAVMTFGVVLTRSTDSVSFYQSDYAIKSYSTFAGVLRNCIFDLDTLAYVFSQRSGFGIFDVVDCTTFGDAYINDTGEGIINQIKTINYNVADSSGTAIEAAKVAVYDTSGTLQTAIQSSDVSGVVDEIQATFLIWTDADPSVDKSPFTIRLRKYDYIYQDFSSLVSDLIKQEVRLQDNTVTVLSEASAAALTGIAINFGANTVTVTASHTMSEIYDYCQSQLALDANMDETEFLKSSDGNVFTFEANWDLILGASGDIAGGTGKTLVFSGTGELQLNDAGNTIDGLSVTGDIDLGALIATITGVTVTGAMDFSVAGTTALASCTINEVTNSSGGAVIIERDAATVITTNTGPNITINAPAVLLTITLPNIIDGSRVQIYNVTADASLDNLIVAGGAGFSGLYTLGTDFTAGDVGRYRISYQSTTTAKEFIEGTFTFPATSATNSVPISQSDQASYNQHAVDGSTITQISWDSGSLHFDINDTDNTIDGKDIGAWYYYFITTATGIDEAAGAVSWLELNKITNCADCVPILFDNVKASPLKITDTWWSRSDGVSIIAPTSNSIQIDPPAVFIAETGVSGLTPTESAKLLSLDTLTAQEVREAMLLTVPGDTVTVYVIGSFTEIDGVPANRVAKWDGSEWSALGTGLSSTARGCAVDSQGNLYVVGDFVTAGGVSADRVAKWNGASWEAMGAGLGGIGDDVVIDSNDNIYVVRRTVDCVVWWNGSSWEGVGGILNTNSELFIDSNDTLYMIGAVTGVGVNREGIVKWDGSAWVLVGNGIDADGGAAPTYGLTEDSAGNLYATGAFTSTRDGAAAYIAKFDGTTWTALGAGLNASGRAITADGLDVYVAGQFTTAGGITATRFALWDGTTWSAPGETGLNSIGAYDIKGQPLTGEMYVVGPFTTANGITANRIAVWNGSAWTTFGAGFNGTAYEVEFFLANNPSIDGKLDDLDILVENLNDISPAEVKAQADLALVEYDGPTKAEQDAAFAEIKGAGWVDETLLDIRDNLGSGGLTPQETRDALLLAPSGAGAADSIDDKLDTNEAKIDAIPTTPLLTGDARLDNLDATISSRNAVAPDNAGIALIPTNPVLDNDVRLDNLDATISSRNAVAPDNAGIAANGVAIGNLNDLSLAQLVAEFDEIKGAGWTTETLKDIRENAGGGLDEAELHAALDSYVNKDGYQADVSGIETKAEADARQALLITEHSATQTDIGALKDFDPAADTVARVALVDVTTTNTDMRGTDNANTVAPDNAGIAAIPTNPLLTTDSRLDNMDAPISLVDTTADADARQAILLAQGTATQALVNNLENLSLAQVTTLFDEIKGAGWTTETLKDIRDNGGTTPADIWTYAARTLTAGLKDAEIDAINAAVRGDAQYNEATGALTIRDFDDPNTILDTFDLVFGNAAIISKTRRP